MQVGIAVCLPRVQEMALGKRPGSPLSNGFPNTRPKIDADDNAAMARFIVVGAKGDTCLNSKLVDEGEAQWIVGDLYPDLKAHIRGWMTSMRPELLIEICAFTILWLGLPTDS